MRMSETIEMVEMLLKDLGLPYEAVMEYSCEPRLIHVIIDASFEVSFTVDMYELHRGCRYVAGRIEQLYKAAQREAFEKKVPAGVRHLQGM